MQKMRNVFKGFPFLAQIPMVYNTLWLPSYGLAALRAVRPSEEGAGRSQGLSPPVEPMRPHPLKPHPRTESLGKEKEGPRNTVKNWVLSKI